MPSLASSAASRPLRVVCPTWNGFVMVPKLALMPDAIEAASASALAVCSTFRVRRWGQAAAAAERPEHRGGIPPFLMVMKVHGPGEARLAFESGGIGGDECLAA